MRGVWAAKAVVQKSISVSGNPQRVNRRLQSIGGRLRLTPETTRQRLGWAGGHLRTFDELGSHGGAADRPVGFRALELGSGWHPVVPLALVAGGAGEVLLCDLEDLSDTALFTEALDAVLGAADSGELAELVPGVRPDGIERLRRAARLVHTDGRFVAMAELGLHVRSGDIRELRPDAAPDLIVSNTVFEHIGPDVLVGILSSFAAMARTGTVMSHLVDMCDHYLYVDDSLNAYHFLRFTEWQWRLIDNDVQPMNRLRVHQYRDLYAAAGVEITRERRVSGSPSDLEGIHLAAPFDTMDPMDVACTAAWFDTLF